MWQKTYHTSSFVAAVGKRSIALPQVLGVPVGLHTVGMSVGLDSLATTPGGTQIFGFVEVGEQEQEHNAVQTDPHHESTWIVALAEQQLELMREDSHELDLKMQQEMLRKWFKLHNFAFYHLEGGEVLLPPDELLVLGAHGGDHVVEVHHDVYKGVEEGEERAVSACNEKQMSCDPL